MPKRSKIVSGKVIAAVEQNRSKVESASVSGTMPTAPSTEASILPTAGGDIKARFQMRKEELETSRKVNDPVNIRVLKSVAQLKKKNKHQQNV